LLHPLKHALNITHYNDRWLTQDTAPLKRKRAPPAPTSPSPTLPPPATPSDALQLFHQITKSRDKLFFISFTTTDAMRPQWYLITVDLSASTIHPSTTDHASTGRYYVNFYAKHPSDNHLSDHMSRWWMEWHEYQKDEQGIIEYGKRVLHRPKTTPDPNRYITWSDDIDFLAVPPLVGPFNFADASQSPTAKNSNQHVALTHWTTLHEA
ncbi:MAG: hypothetical protein ACREOZ_01315, partial [Gloeomargaritales cyanobacterium]